MTNKSKLFRDLMDRIEASRIQWPPIEDPIAQKSWDRHEKAITALVEAVKDCYSYLLEVDGAFLESRVKEHNELASRYCKSIDKLEEKESHVCDRVEGGIISQPKAKKRLVKIYNLKADLLAQGTLTIKKFHRQCIADDQKEIQ